MTASLLYCDRNDMRYSHSPIEGVGTAAFFLCSMADIEPRLNE